MYPKTMLLEINITSSRAYPVYKPHFRLRVSFWSRARTSKPFSPLYYYIGTVWWISQTFVVQQSSMWTGCEGLHERSVFWRTGSLWMCAPSIPHPVFFSFLSSSPTISWKRRLSVHWKTDCMAEREQGKRNCSSYVMSLFSVPLVP